MRELSSSATIEPLFDLRNPGAGLDMLHQNDLPITAPRLDGLYSGVTTSTYLGQGSDRDGTRLYAPGDDAHKINWRVSARDPFGMLHTQEYYDERIPRVVLVSDASHNRFAVGTNYETGFTKQELAVSTFMGFSAIASAQRMSHSAIIDMGTDVIDTDFDRGDDHDVHIAETFLNAIRANQYDDSRGRLKRLLERTAQMVTERSVIVVVSDFLDEADPNHPEFGWANSLIDLRELGHSIITNQVFDQQDVELSKYDNTFQIGSSSSRWFGRGRKQLRAKYAEITSNQQQTISNTLHSVDATHTKSTTHGPAWNTDLQQQLDQAT